MRILIVADGQSPHARNWILHLVERGYEVHLATTYPCETAGLGIRSVHTIPVDFSARARAGEKASTMGSGAAKGGSKLSRLRGTALWKALAQLRNASAPFLARIQSRRLRKVVGDVKPDLVHSMRIPFEGILAGHAVRGMDVRFAVSTWGNDFSLFAAESEEIAKATRMVVARADGLHSDCEEDVRFAIEYGYDRLKPTLVAPGNGGLDASVFYPAPAAPSLRERYSIPLDARVVINPRGLKPYIRVEESLEAFALVRERFPKALLLLASMEGKEHVREIVARLGIPCAVRLLPSVPHAEMAGLFRLSEIALSPSDHDGTPNTLLEAIACGCFPIAGDIPSVGEWIDDGVNGLLCDQKNPTSIAEALGKALDDADLRERARVQNTRIIATRARFDAVSANIDRFYRDVAE